MKLTILLLLPFVFSVASAQITVNARIINYIEKKAIPYATIMIKNNSTKGVIADAEGSFSLQCNHNDSITVHCVGYKTLSVLATEAIQKQILELTEDTITLSEVTVSPENAYRLLLQARDSTIKHQMKSFQGICKRQDKLSFKDKTQRKSDAEIFFKTKKNKNGYIENDYWLNDHKLESSSEVSNQPHLSYPNTIPLTLSFEKILSKKMLSNANCIISSSSDNMLVIRVKLARSTRNFINECSYFVNRNTLIFNGFEYTGDFRMNPMKDVTRHRFLTNIKLTYTNIGDSCVLGNFNYKMVFSQKNVDPQNLWEYFVNMDIIPIKNATPMLEDKKLRPLDYLLYKNKDK